jgi:putative FmdB family regulatory protein
MPIFEYLCRPCNRIYSFLSLRLQPEREPICPRCGSAELTRVPSAFAVTGTRKTGSETPSRGADGPPAPGAGLEGRALQMADEMSEADAEDPRAMARMMRRLARESGEPITPTLDEMFRRMEAGEDPEALEEELGPRLEEEMGGEDDQGSGGTPSRDDGLYSL